MTEAPKLETMPFAQGTHIFVEGKPADSFFIIMKGQARLFKELELEKKERSILKTGDFIGVVAALSGHTHIETAEAVTDVVLIKVNRKQFEGVISHNPPVATKVITQFVQHNNFLVEALTDAGYQSEPVAEQKSADKSAKPPAATPEAAKKPEETVPLATASVEGAVPVDDTSVLYRAGEFYEKNERKKDACYVYHKYLERFPDGEFSADAKSRLSALAGFDEPENREGSSLSYGSGEIFFAEGEIGDKVFVLLKGSVNITKIINGNEVVLSTRKTGDLFGEMAALSPRPRSVTAIATENCAVMVMDARTVITAAAAQPHIIEKLCALLAEHLWFSYKQLTNASIDDPVGRMFDAMAIYLEKNKIAADDRRAFKFNFSPDELAQMVAVKEADLKTVIAQVLQNRSLSVSTGRLTTNDPSEIYQQCVYFRNTQQRKNKMNKAKKIDKSKLPPQNEKEI